MVQDTGKDASAVEAWLTSRDPVRLSREASQGQGQLHVALTNGRGEGTQHHLRQGTHFSFPPSLQAQQ